MKKILITILVIVVLIIAALVLLFSNINSLVAKAIEKNGSNVTQTSVSVSGVDISLREGRGTIKGLRIANPPGFDTRDAFKDRLQIGDSACFRISMSRACGKNRLSSRRSASNPPLSAPRSQRRALRTSRRYVIT